MASFALCHPKLRGLDFRSRLHEQAPAWQARRRLRGVGRPATAARAAAHGSDRRPNVFEQKPPRLLLLLTLPLTTYYLLPATYYYYYYHYYYYYYYDYYDYYY